MSDDKQWNLEVQEYSVLLWFDVDYMVDFMVIHAPGSQTYPEKRSLWMLPTLGSRIIKHL